MVKQVHQLLSYIVKIILFIIMELDKKNIYTLQILIGNTSHIYRSFYFQSIQFWNKLMSNNMCVRFFFFLCVNT